MRRDYKSSILESTNDLKITLTQLKEVIMLDQSNNLNDLSILVNKCISNASSQWVWWALQKLKNEFGIALLKDIRPALVKHNDQLGVLIQANEYLEDKHVIVL